MLILPSKAFLSSPSFVSSTNLIWGVLYFRIQVINKLAEEQEWTSVNPYLRLPAGLTLIHLHYPLLAVIQTIMSLPNGNSI